MMDDDFNTAGAIGVLHEMATSINAFLDRVHDRAPAAEAGEISEPLPPLPPSGQLLRPAGAAARTLRNLAQLLGLFTAPRPAAARGEQGLTPKLIELLIQLRTDARKTKNFALADDVRKGLEKIGITLEDGPSGTLWRAG
jgi:cysteinyl-tRNA synthetase